MLTGLMSKKKETRCRALALEDYAAFALAAGETLQAAELVHRWSFNGDYSDSAGGARQSMVSSSEHGRIYYL